MGYGDTYPTKKMLLEIELSSTGPLCLDDFEDLGSILIACPIKVQLLFCQRRLSRNGGEVP